MSNADSYDDTYTESQVIMTSVKIIAPFILTYGMFMSLHGADTPGGSFQGGAIIGVTVLMLAFAFGPNPARSRFHQSPRSQDQETCFRAGGDGRPSEPGSAAAAISRGAGRTYLPAGLR